MVLNEHQNQPDSEEFIELWEFLTEFGMLIFFGEGCLGHFGLDVFTLFEGLLPLDDLGHT